MLQRNKEDDRRLDPEARLVSGAQSIERALGILKAVAMGRDKGQRISDIATLLGLSRQTVQRILAALMREGLVEYHASSRHYQVGAEVAMLALARPSPANFQRRAESVLREASRRLGDTIFMAVRSGGDTICTARLLGSYPVQILSIEVGDRRPLGAIPAGIAILAQMPPMEAEQLVVRDERRLIAFKTSVADVLAFLTETRARGYVVRRKGLIPGTKAVSMAFMPYDGSQGAAVTVTAVSDRLTEPRIQEVAEILQDATARLSLHQQFDAVTSTGEKD